MQQVKLKNKNEYLITWVDKSVKIGDACTLKDDDTMYDVIETYSHMEKEKINRTWRVGGIDHPLV